MNRVNLVGASFTIAMLMCLLMISMYQTYRAQLEVIRCYREQVKDVVTIKPISDD